MRIGGAQHARESNREVASENNALLASVGETWWGYMKEHPDLELYQDDGAHASLVGSEYAAKIIWETIEEDITRKQINLS